MTTNKLRAVHPGEILREDYLRPLGMSNSALAKALNVSRTRINQIVRERRSVTADTALRIARYFSGEEADAQGWINLQAAYDLKMIRPADRAAIAREIQPRRGSVDPTPAERSSKRAR